MHTATSDARLTYRDLLRFPDDGKRHELIDGVHYVTPSPFSPHQRVAGNLHFLIRFYLESHPIGKIFMAPLDIVLSMFDVVEPDLLFISNARIRILTDKHIHGAPDLVVEVASKATQRRDEGVKLRLYDRVEIAEYWLADPATERVRVYRRDVGRLTRAIELGAASGSADLTSPLLPGLRLPLERIFAP
jgi:Uma2 family endonuclease